MAIARLSKKFTQGLREYRYEFLCDTDEDFASLPEADVGSTAVSAASGNIRIVNTAGAWVPFAEG